jgi:hypothetical protein
MPCWLLSALSGTSKLEATKKMGCSEISRTAGDVLLASFPCLLEISKVAVQKDMVFRNATIRTACLSVFFLLPSRFPEASDYELMSSSEIRRRISYGPSAFFPLDSQS